MKLTKIFNDLRYGTLKGQAIAREGAEIEEIDYPRLITCINAGLTALYGRFKLGYKEVIIRLIPEKYTYELHSDYAESNTESTQSVRWIVDKEEAPFSDDIVRVHTAITNTGDELSINNDNDCMSVMTPSYNSVQFPAYVADKLESVSVTYEASPTLLDVSPTLAPEVTEVKIPDVMAEALCYYAAAKFMEQSSAQDKSAKAMEFYQKYELQCTKLEEYGMVNKNLTDDSFGGEVWP